MRCKARLIHVFCAILGVFALPLRAAEADKAAEVFESLYGAKVKAVKATRDAADDIELAARLLAAAKEAAKQPGFLAVLCEKAADLGGHPKREIFEGARWDPATMLLATEIEGDVGGTPEMSGGLLDTRLDEPKYDPKRHARALADTRRALKEFWDACLCTLCYPGASE